MDGDRWTPARHVRALAVIHTTSTLGDAELLRRFVDDRDEAAFAALVERHGPMVLRVCRRVLDHAQDAEDAWQATFLVLARRATSVRRRGSVASWLFGVATRTARKLRASRARRQSRDEVGDATPAKAGDDPSWREVLAVLDEELLRLAEKYRAPLVLCFLEGQTRDEAAGRLGLSANQLRGRLDYGRELLRARLTRRGVTLPAGLLTGLVVGSGSAAVPPLLATATTKAAGLAAAGQRLPADLVPARVDILAKGVLGTMTTMKLKLLAAGFILAAVGAGLSTARPSAQPANPPTSAVLGEVAAADTPPKAEDRPMPKVDITYLIMDSDAAASLAFSPDDQSLAVGGFDKKVRLWDASFGRLVQTLEGFGGTVRSVAFSPDIKTLAAGADDGIVSLWNLASGKRETVLEAQLPRKADKPGSPRNDVYINGLWFLPGARLAVAYNYQDKDGGERHSQILIWDLGTRTAVVLSRQKGGTRLSASPDGKLLAAALDGEFNGFRVWDTDRRTVVWEEKAGREEKVSGDLVTAVLFDATGTRLAVGGGDVIKVDGGTRVEGRLAVFDTRTRKELWSIKEPACWSFSYIAFTPDGRGVLTGNSGPVREHRVEGGAAVTKNVSNIRRWDAATGDVVWQVEGAPGSYMIAPSPDGKLLAGSDDGGLKLFDPATGSPRKVLMKWSYWPAK